MIDLLCRCEEWEPGLTIPRCVLKATQEDGLCDYCRNGHRDEPETT